MTTQTHTPVLRAGRPRAVPAAGALLLLAVLAVLGGCDINKPEMPTFDTTVSLPLGSDRLDVMEAVDSEDFLGTGPDGSLLFQVAGDPDTLDFVFDLSAEIDAQSFGQDLGAFDLATVGPLAYGFRLEDVWAPAAAADGLTLPVPAFPFAVTSADQDVPDIASATLSAGTGSVTITNALPVPVSAASGPNQVTLVLESPAGATFATFAFGLIPAGQSRTVTVDLAGAVLPDRLRVRLSGGSPGSGGQPVTVDRADALDVSASFSGLVVSQATAAVGAQSFSTSFSSPLPAGYEITEAAIAHGSSQLNVTNGLPIPCTATLTWPDLRDAQGQPFRRQYDLAAGASTVRTLDFAGYTLVAGASPLTALDGQITVESPGSAGQPVTMSASDGLNASLSPATISFGSASGIVPESVVTLTPTVTHIDLPEELNGLSLTAASLTLHLDTTASLPGVVDLTLSGTRQDGTVAQLSIQQPLNDGLVQSATDIVLDQDNSDIVDFLNNLPERITVQGQVSLGGDGAVGTVRPNDTAVFSWEIEAPVEVMIDGATLGSDPRLLEFDADLAERIQTHAQGARAELEVLNHLPLALSVTLLVGTDPTTLDSAPLLTVGPLTVAAAQFSPTTHIVTTPVVSRPSFSLTAEQARVFGLPGIVTKFTATLPSTNGQAVRVQSTDWVQVQGIVQLDVLVDDQL